MAHPKPRKWTPRNPEKYVGDVNNIIARSSWEVKFMNYCDSHPEVLKYSSEELVIPYISPVDGRPHRYFVDFIILVKTRTGELKRIAVEIKPLAQCFPPSTQAKTAKQRARVLNETATYHVNQAKWAAAREFCRKRGMSFEVLTERELNV